MRWPRGRFNGQRIVGVELRVRVQVTHWYWSWPSLYQGRCLGCGPLCIWIEPTYDWTRDA